MSYIDIKVHIVFSTKNREPLLTQNLRDNIFHHIKQNSIEKNIFIDCINGHLDHIHCLVSLGKDDCISKVVQLIKGESSHWINQNKLMPKKFTWQGEYYAVGVGKSELSNVRTYIFNQSIHHERKSFVEEVDELTKNFGMEMIR